MNKWNVYCVNRGGNKKKKQQQQLCEMLNIIELKIKTKKMESRKQPYGKENYNYVNQIYGENLFWSIKTISCTKFYYYFFLSILCNNTYRWIVDMYLYMRQWNTHIETHWSNKTLKHNIHIRYSIHYYYVLSSNTYNTILVFRSLNKRKDALMHSISISNILTCYKIQGWGNRKEKRKRRWHIPPCTTVIIISSWEPVQIITINV